MYFKKPNFRGADKYKLNKDVYTVEYIQEKESFQPKIVEEEDKLLLSKATLGFDHGIGPV